MDAGRELVPHCIRSVTGVLTVGDSARAAAYSQRKPKRIKGIDTAIAPIIQRLVFGCGWFIL